MGSGVIGASFQLTSPRLRGEVGLRSNPGEGDSPRTELVESPPHPNPLPASGAREKLNRRSVLALIAGVLLPAQARAAAYPSRPIKIIVPFGPGGSGDITARLIGKQIEDRTK